VVVTNVNLDYELSKDDLLKILKEKDRQIELLNEQISNSDDNLELERAEAMRVLAARLAHDLRNPLSIIKNIVEILETKHGMRIEEKIIQYRKLDRAIERISHQIEDVLEYANKKKLNQDDYLVTDLIHLATVGMIIPEKVHLNIEKKSSMINCDQKQMIAVFSNLLLNAIQAVKPEGTIDVKIRDDADKMIISFIDSGNGIAQDASSKIFDPLFTTKQEGTGLGLSICKKIVEQHDGTIEFSNDPTTFSVILPKNS
jgi:two-component system sensor histidine kinase HydH